MSSPKTDKKQFSFKKLYKEKTVIPFNLHPEVGDNSNPPQDFDCISWINFYLKKEVIGIESKHTVRAKCYDLHKFYVYSQHVLPGKDLKAWDKAFSAAFVTALDKEYEVSSVYRTFATMTNFARFLILYSVILPIHNPVKNIKLQNQELPPPQGIQLVSNRKNKPSMDGRELYDLLIKTAKGFLATKGSVMPYRDIAIIALFHNTGFRVDELCSLTISQMDLTDQGGMWLRNVKCKGKKVRKVYVKKNVVSLIQNYMNRERGQKPGFLFVSCRGKRLNQPDISRILGRIKKEAEKSLPVGVTIDLHPHSFRHERCYNLKKAQLGDATIAEQMGWSSTKQIARYSRRTEEEEEKLLANI
jgi:integrase